MSTSKEEKNKALVLEAFDTLFNKRDYSAAERYWSAELYPAQRTYPSGAGRSVQLDQSQSAFTEIRTWIDHG